MPKESKICPQLQYADKRKKLAPRHKPYFLHGMGKGLVLGCRRNAEKADKWVIKFRNPKTGKECWQIIGWCGDGEAADGRGVLDFHQARAKAEKIAFGSRPTDVKYVTLDEALRAYEKHLKKNNARIYRAQQPRVYLTPLLLAQAVQLTTKEELTAWHESILEENGGKCTRVNYSRNLRGAILTAVKLAAGEVLGVWEAGLPSLGDNRPKDGVRNVILEGDIPERFVAKCYERDVHLGYLMHTFLHTGNRPAQLARLTVDAFIDDPARPRIMMRRSRKGGGDGAKRAQKGRGEFSLPLPPDLVVRLRECVKGRAAHEPLLVQADGKAWNYGGDNWGRELSPYYYYRYPIRAIVKELNQQFTAYALRHTKIVKLIEQNVHLRVIAAAHDTSQQMIETHYSRQITDHSDEILRKALLQTDALLQADLGSMIGHNGGPAL
jgi:hypothetical protein